MTRVRAAAAWLLLVPAGSVLLGVGLMLAAPGVVLGAVGLAAWKVADRLLRRPRIVPVNVDDDRWRSYLAHPAAQGWARNRIRR